MIFNVVFLWLGKSMIFNVVFYGLEKSMIFNVVFYGLEKSMIFKVFLMVEKQILRMTRIMVRRMSQPDVNKLSPPSL